MASATAMMNISLGFRFIRLCWRDPILAEIDMENASVRNRTDFFDKTPSPALLEKSRLLKKSVAWHTQPASQRRCQRELVSVLGKSRLEK